MDCILHCAAVERAGSSRKGLVQDGWDADDVDCVGMAGIGLALTRLLVLRMPHFCQHSLDKFAMNAVVSDC